MGVYRRKIRGQRAKSFNAKFVFRGQLHQRGGFPDKDAAQDWIDTNRAQLRRGELGYVKARTAAKLTPLIDEYADHLRTLKRSEKYAQIAQNRLTKIAKEVPWMTVGDISEASLDNWRAGKPRYRKAVIIKPKTINQYLDIASGFCEWLVKPKKLLPNNPLATMSRTTAVANDRYRRAATVEELTKLLAASPPERRIVYQFLIYLPLRRRAVTGIEWRDFELTGERPTFTLRAELSKNGRATKMAIRQDLAQALTVFKGGADADDLVFRQIPSVDELREDLFAAGVPFDDGKGQRRLDLHAFRKTVIRLLKRSGVPLDEAHIFLQHRDRRTTERHYDDDLVDPEITRSAEKMPAIGMGPQ